MFKYYKSLALGEAHQSMMSQKHGCIIIKNKKVIARGHNKNLSPIGLSPWEVFSSSKLRTYKKGVSVHAEMDAINKCSRKDLRGSILIVVRLDKKTGTCAGSKPCSNCERVLKKMIRDYGLKRIYFS